MFKLRYESFFVYCEDCKSFFMEECGVHGPPLFVPDIPAPLGTSDRARLTLPSGLEIRTSSIPEAGLGVFNHGNTVPAGAHYGPYEGEITDKEQAMESGYSWVINKSRHWDDYIDAGRDTHSNWMRYVNCARREEEQNLVSFQYRGGILYRCCKPIAVGEELLVWYGEEYARDLGIVFDYLWDKKSSAKGHFSPLHPLFIPVSALTFHSSFHSPYNHFLFTSYYFINTHYYFRIWRDQIRESHVLQQLNTAPWNHLKFLQPSSHQEKERDGQATIKPLLPVWEEFHYRRSSQNTPAHSHRREAISLLSVWEEFHYRG
uniref:SET domain-containing protein n=1 Tax=Oncorhynchus kisutch TaxID=8019 RepID=A0A8C7MW54_ONCKI